MDHGCFRRTGALRVFAGPMFSGKTREALNLIDQLQRRGHAVQAFKWQADNRPDMTKGCIGCHNGLEIPAVEVTRAEEIYPHLQAGTSVIFIDETQFLGDQVVSVCMTLYHQKYMVVCTMFDMDWRGNPFPSSAELMARATHLKKLAAVCRQCGRRASYSQRLVSSTQTIVVGGAESYEPRCANCFQPNAFANEPAN